MRDYYVVHGRTIKGQRQFRSVAIFDMKIEHLMRGFITPLHKVAERNDTTEEAVLERIKIELLIRQKGWQAPSNDNF